MAIGARFLTGANGVKFRDSTSVNWFSASKFRRSDNLLLSSSQNSAISQLAETPSFKPSKSVKFRDSTSVHWYSRTGNRSWESFPIVLNEQSKVIAKTSDSLLAIASSLLIENSSSRSKTDLIRTKITETKTLVPKTLDNLKTKLFDVVHALGYYFFDTDSLLLKIDNAAKVTIKTSDTFRLKLNYLKSVKFSSSDTLLISAIEQGQPSPRSTDSLLITLSDSAIQSVATEISSIGDTLLLAVSETQTITKYLPPVNYLKEALLGFVTETDRFLVVGKTILPGGKVRFKLLKL